MTDIKDSSTISNLIISHLSMQDTTLGQASNSNDLELVTACTTNVLQGAKLCDLEEHNSSKRKRRPSDIPHENVKCLHLELDATCATSVLQDEELCDLEEHDNINRKKRTPDTSVAHEHTQCSKQHKSKKSMRKTSKKFVDGLILMLRDFDDEQLIVRTEAYVQQCCMLLSDPEKYYHNVSIVGEQYSTYLLREVSKRKKDEHYILKAIMPFRTKYENEDDIITRALHNYKTQEALESYANHCGALLAYSRTAYESVKIVGEQCSHKTLGKLIAGKDKEWDILGDIYYARVRNIDSIYTTLNSVTRLVAKTPSSYCAPGNSDILILQHLHRSQYALVFGTATAKAARIFLRVLTKERLDAFKSCLMLMLPMMYEVIDARNPSQEVKDKVQKIIEKGKAIDNRADICDVGIINFAVIGDVINIYNTDMNFVGRRRSEYNACMYYNPLKTILLLYEYLLALKKEVDII